jgi:hypothetical protein
VKFLQLINKLRGDKTRIAESGECHKLSIAVEANPMRFPDGLFAVKRLLTRSKNSHPANLMSAGRGATLLFARGSAGPVK